MEEGVIYLTQRVLDAIRDHALNPKPKRPGREVVGVVIMGGSYAKRYVPMRNRARGDNRFTTYGSDEPELRPGEWLFLVHSHPSTYDTPSDGDHKRAGSRWLEKPYGIFSVGHDRLRLFTLWSKKPGDHDDCEFVVI